MEHARSRARLVIALAGGLLGLLVSVWTTGTLLHILPEDTTGGWIAAALDTRLLLFTLALSLGTGPAPGRVNGCLKFGTASLV